MSEYRLGNFSEAIAWGEKAAKSAATFAQAKAYAVLAMAHWQLGQKDEARAALARGDALAPRAEDLGESWVAWLMARISLDEARRLIQIGSTINENSNQP
jgi:Flp pilus assembly protein TadD